MAQSKKSFLNPIVWTALILAVLTIACGKEKPVIHSVDHTDRQASKFPPLTPVLINEANQAFADALVAEQGVPAPVLPSLEYISDQGPTNLCQAFAIRDLMYNNLNLPKLPSVFGLLLNHREHNGRLVVSDEAIYDYENFQFLKLAHFGSDILTEKSFPFEEGFYKNFKKISNGKGFTSENYTIPPGKVDQAPLLDQAKEDGGKLLKTLFLDPAEVRRTRSNERVTIPPFHFLQDAITTLTLVEQMKILAKNLAHARGQYLSVCGKLIRGFSRKLFTGPKKSFMNESDSPTDCGPHAVVLTRAYTDSSGTPHVIVKNSWGTDFSDTGLHDLTVEQLITILHTDTTANGPELSSRRIEVVAAEANVQPIFQISNPGGWVISGQTVDGVHPTSPVNYSRPRIGDKFTCKKEADENIEADWSCAGRTLWTLRKHRKEWITYDGDFSLSKVTNWGFKYRNEEGDGVQKLWGNEIARGTFHKGILRKGIYSQYFSQRKSSYLMYSEEGEFDEKENLVRGVAKHYDRAGTLIKEKTFGTPSKIKQAP